MLDVVLVAGLHIHTQHQSQIRQHVGVIAVRRPTGLVRIVAKFGTLLLPIQRLDRGVDVQYPRLVQERRNRVVKMALQPGQPGASSILPRLRRTASSLSTLRMPSSGGFTGSQRSAVMWA